MSFKNKSHLKLSFAILLVMVPFLALPQNGQGKKFKFSSTVLLDKSGNSLSKGKIYELKDSSIVMFNGKISSDLRTEIAVKNIEAIVVKDLGKGPRGFLIGAGIGSIAGALVSLTMISKDRHFRPTQVVVPVMIGFGSGGLIGALIGNQRETIFIYREKKAYEMEKDKLRDYSFL